LKSRARRERVIRPQSSSGRILIQPYSGGPLDHLGKSPFLIGSEARLREIWSSGSCMVLIANARDLHALQDSLKPAPVVIGCEGRKFALYNGALAPPPDAADCLRSEAKN